MKIIKMLFAVLGFGLLVGATFAAGNPVTQKFEVVCLKCMAHNAAMGKNGGHGAGHAACAMSCSTKGMDMGLMDPDGRLYSVIKNDFTSARDVIKDKAGQTVELTGFVIKTKGILYFQLADENASLDTKAGMKKDKEGDKDGD